MKKFLMSSLKIGLGIFIAFILIGIVAVIIAPEDDTNITNNVGSSAETQQTSQQASQPAVEATTSTPAETPSDTAIETVASYDDAQWISTMVTDTSIMQPDMQNVGTIASNIETAEDMNSLATYSGYLYDSTQTALINSNKYNVSPDLQPAKDEYNQGISDINLACAYIYQSVTEFNSGNLNQATSLMEDAKTYINSGTVHITRAATLLEGYNKKMGFN